MQYDLPLDFVMSFCRDKISGRGEDSYCYSFCDTAGLLGAFDGCGGAGARRHDYYSGHTEAFMASRFCAGSFYDQFRKHFPGYHIASDLTKKVFGPRTAQRLLDFGPPKDTTGFQIKGSSVRTLPSTAAVALIQQQENGSMLVSAIWAGDSRVYILDSRGLAQLTVDDATVTDPMVNIYEDGVLKNMVCSDRPVNLHCKSVVMQEPFVVFTATDGCYGFLSTPMEFEGVLLETLLESGSVNQWETSLAGVLGSVAGDDYTLCLASYGYGTYEALQAAFARHYEKLSEKYLRRVSGMPLEDRQSRYRLWNSYRDNYMRYIKDGPA